MHALQARPSYSSCRPALVQRSQTLAPSCKHVSHVHAIGWYCRYVGYFWAVLCSGPGPVGLLPRPRSLQLRQVTISGLPPGTADSCVLLVEARPSGSLAPSASRVCARSAPRAPSGSLTGELAGCNVHSRTPWAQRALLAGSVDYSVQLSRPTRPEPSAWGCRQVA
jgi:hypothetical protein